MTSATSFGARMAMAEAQVTGPFRPEWKAELVHGNSIELGCLTVDSFLQMIFYMLHFIHIDLYLDSNDNIIQYIICIYIYICMFTHTSFNHGRPMLWGFFMSFQDNFKPESLT